MRQGFTLLWMGWQWDVPERPGAMRMEMPIATENGKPITGLVRGNFILNERDRTPRRSPTANTRRTPSSIPKAPRT